MHSVGSSTSLSENNSSITDVVKVKRRKPKWQATASEVWIDEVANGRKFIILNGLQFCRTWTLSDSIRDLIQNATDSMYTVHKKQHRCKRPRVIIDSPPESWDPAKNIITKIYLECDKGVRTGPAGYLVWTVADDSNKGPIISIINLNAGFEPDALCVGLSTKGDHDAGGHGEGLKAAITAAIRTHNAVEVYQSGIAIKFRKGEQVVSYRVVSPVNKILEFKSFTKELGKTVGVAVDNDVIVHLGNNRDLKFEEYQEAVRSFLFLTHRHPNSIEKGLPIVNRRETKSGRALLLGDEFAGKVYAVGIYYLTQEGFQTSYGVDFIKSDALNRDRNTISQKKYLWAMGELVSELLEDDPQFAYVILNEFEKAKIDPKVVHHLDFLPRCASKKAKDALIVAYKKMPENSAVTYIVSGTSAEHLLDNAIVPRWCDVRACRVVSPVLYDLISEGYPALDEIKAATSKRLEECPPLFGQRDELRRWFKHNREFFNTHNLEKLLYLIEQIEVRKTDYTLDVPLYIIKDGIIIFSERAEALKVTQPRKFLDLANEAFQEALASNFVMRSCVMRSCSMETETTTVARVAPLQKVLASTSIFDLYCLRCQEVIRLKNMF